MRTLSWGAPGTKAGYNLALWTSALNRPREALRALQSLNPDREPMRGWLSYFTVFSGAAHAVGELEEELVMARKARTQFPDIRAANLEALALASLGRTTELDALLDQIATMPAVGTLDPGDVMVNAGLELAAHGAGADARRHAERAVAWYDARPEEEARTPDARSGKAYALYTLARYREAAALYGALAREAPANGTYQAWTGILAGLAGDKRTAAEVAGRFEAGEIQVTPANRAIWRGLIAAAVGERERAVALLRESGVRARWMHRDPMLRATILEHPAFAGYLAPEG